MCLFILYHLETRNAYNTTCAKTNRFPRGFQINEALQMLECYMHLSDLPLHSLSDEVPWMCDEI